MSDWYVIKSPVECDEGVVWADAFEVEPKTLGNASRCRACGRPTSMLPWLPPHTAELEIWGNEYADIAFAGGDDLLISDRFMRIYQEHNLTGFEGFWPCRIVRARRRGGGRKKLPEIPPYYVVHLARSSVEIDENASGVVREPPGMQCSVCHGGGPIRGFRRIVLKSEPHLPQDVFMPHTPKPRIVSSRFKNICDQHRITGAKFIPIAEYSRAPVPYGNWPDQSPR